jgi:hypothetical protein
MAIITLGGGVAQASGSIGGTTFSRNRGGPYMRARSVPINPNTTYQQAVRHYMTDLTSRWLSTLTADQRAAWDNYALQVPLPNPLGQPRNVGGIAMYVRSNIPRLQIGATRVDDAPTIFNLGEYTAPSGISASEATQNISVGFDNTDAWANEDNAHLILYASRPLNASISGFTGPYRQYASVDGDSVTPPTSPTSDGAPFPFLQGQNLGIRARVTRADGRLSSSFRHLFGCAA